MLNFGGFLSSNFWTNYRCQSSASIEDLLNSKDCTVDKLLDDDDCLQEFKNYNDKLIKYFDHDKLKTLIDYITVMPDKDDGHNRGRKYPFITGEIFNCEINQILDKFFEAPLKIKEAEKSQVEDEDAEADDKDSDDKKSEKSDKEGDQDEAAKEPIPGQDQAEETKSEEGVSTNAATNLEETAAVEGKTDENPQGQAEDKSATEEPKSEDDVKKETEEQSAEEVKNTQEPESEEQNQGKTESVTGEESVKKSEPEEEEATEKKESENQIEENKESLSTVEGTEATLETEPHEPEVEDEDKYNKYQLLDRLFKFVRTSDNEQLNPVLSGYFCKLVSLLISRKQKLLIPYIFAPGQDIIEQLLKHVYQKSISEILNKLLTQVDQDFEPEIMAQIKEKQQLAVSKLIDQLGPQAYEESNLNACSIILDMFEIKEFYNIICKKENVQKIAKFALEKINESTKNSKCASLQVLNAIIKNHNERQKKKDQKGDQLKDTANYDDDDMIVQQNSEDEANEDTENVNQNSQQAQSNALIEILISKVNDIDQILSTDHQGDKIVNTVCDSEFVPLGTQRLYTVELVLRMTQIRKESIYNSLADSQIFKKIIQLVKIYQWNNFLQLKVIDLFEEILNNCDDNKFKQSVLQSSTLGEALVEMGSQASYQMESTKQIRSGFMALVVSVSNKLVKKTEQVGVAEPEKQEDITIINYLDNVQKWRDFVDGELKKSNENNKRTLGGSVRRGSDDEEKDDSNYDVQMEKIMARFTNFNQILSQGSSNEEEEDDDEEETTKDEGNTDDGTKNFDEDDDHKEENKKPEDQLKVVELGNSPNGGYVIQKVDIKAPEPLVKEFIDSNYWKVEDPGVADVDALLAELEL